MNGGSPNISGIDLRAIDTNVVVRHTPPNLICKICVRKHKNTPDSTGHLANESGVFQL